MLTQYDIDIMAKDVDEIIRDWGEVITIKRPKPIASQTNWNPILHEYSGEVLYDIISNIPAERKDIMNIYLQDIKVEDNTGKREYGYQAFAIPIIVNNLPLDIDMNDIFIIDDSGDEYFVKSVRPRIGENIVLIAKYVGGKP